MDFVGADIRRCGGGEPEGFFGRQGFSGKSLLYLQTCILRVIRVKRLLTFSGIDSIGRGSRSKGLSTIVRPPSGNSTKYNRGPK